MSIHHVDELFEFFFDVLDFQTLISNSYFAINNEKKKKHWCLYQVSQKSKKFVILPVKGLIFNSKLGNIKIDCSSLFVLRFTRLLQ